MPRTRSDRGAFRRTLTALLVVALVPAQAYALVQRRGPASAGRYRQAVPVALSGQAAIGDFDGDGHPDLVAWVGASALAVFRGPVLAAPGSSFPGLQSPTVGDVDGDGDLDIVAIEPAPIPPGGGKSPPTGLVTLRNDGHANFVAVPSRPDGWSFGSIIGLTDVTGDGRADLVVTAAPVTDYTDGALTIATGAGDGRFTTTAPIAGVGGAFAHAALADVDGDGRMDIVFVTIRDGALEVSRSSGGAFDLPRAATSVAGLGEFAIADLNGDGALDVVATNTGVTELVVEWNHGGTLVEGPVFPSGLHSSEALGDFAAAGDINGDGRIDIIVKTSAVPEGRQPPGNDALRVYLNQDDGRFSSGRVIRGLAARSQPILLGDLDGDGTTDLVTNKNVLLSAQR